MPQHPYNTYVSPEGRFQQIRAGRLANEGQQAHNVAMRNENALAPARARGLQLDNQQREISVEMKERALQEYDDKLKTTNLALHSAEILSLPPQQRRVAIEKLAQNSDNSKFWAEALNQPEDQVEQMLGNNVSRAQMIGAIKLPEAPTTTDIKNYNAALADGSWKRENGGFNEFLNASKRSGASQVNNYIAGENKEVFGEEIAKKSAQGFYDQYGKAENAARSIQSTVEAERLLDSGAITGFGAKFLTGFGKALNQMGFSVGKDEIANTEAYIAAQATQVAEIIKAFGAGTGLSDKDREFAESAAGANVNMSEGSLRYVLDINRRRYRTLVEDVNKKLESIPEEYRPFMNPIQLPDVPGFAEKESVQDRIRTLSTFNRGMEPDEMPFGTTSQVRKQLKDEGYNVSKVSDDEISKLLVAGRTPVEPEETPSDFSFDTVEQAEAANLPVGTEITIGGRRAIVE